jgi:hypothetical protein
MADKRCNLDDGASCGGPSEDEIIHLLEGFRPQPGRGFYDEMKKAPWHVGRRPPGAVPGLFGRSLLGTLGGLLLVAILVAVSLAMPVRSFAGDLLGYFVHARSDRLTLGADQTGADYNLGRGWQLPPPPAPQPISISRAETLAGIRVAVPEGMPGSFRFEGAYYLDDTMSVQLAYVVDGEALLTLTEMPAQRQPTTPEPDEPAAVGASAAIEVVRVGSVLGEYVHGGWALAADHPPTTVAVTGEESPGLQVVWDPDAAMQTLRWQEGSMLYEITLVGGRAGSDAFLDREALVMIARSLR